MTNHEFEPTKPRVEPVPLEAAEFLKSAAKLGQCPPDNGAEVAFCGRSNAGKSSALNTLTGQKNSLEPVKLRVAPNSSTFLD